MFELNSKGRSDANTGHLLNVDILLELANHNGLQSLYFAFILISQVLHEHVTCVVHLLDCSPLVIIDWTGSLLADITVRLVPPDTLCIFVSLEQEVGVTLAKVDLLRLLFFLNNH